ncbi:MAG: carbamoyltransferase HypF [Desulfobacterales bacterium]|nr:MAG: carbamoyltransferase HypF [Desulfobacterales bacterium]
MTCSNRSALRINIQGVVQGVGFRPFLYSLAGAHGLFGRVSNTANGVDLFVEGSETALDAFVKDIQVKKPLLSRISAIDTRVAHIQGLSRFDIVKSKGCDQQFTLISPDVSMCQDCLDELKDPCNRRFEYPFINCTNCGPRYTIIEDIPYDRPRTSMRDFPMCPVCRAEYENPLDRRFHAQPNACPTCGPQVFLTDRQGQRIDRDPGHALDKAAALLAQGKILAIKGIGGFHLACDARNEDAVGQLRRRKKRPDKPFALMAASERSVFKYVHADPKEIEWVNSFHRPIVLFRKKKGAGGLAPSLAPLNASLGIMLPYTPLHYLLLSKGPDILVMTSGNRSKEPLSVDNEDALDAFAHIADYFLFHNRDIYFRADDSILQMQKGKPRFLRRSRGYAPLPIDLRPFEGDRLPMVLGCGAGMKSTICLTRNRYGFMSPHIGDLENPKVHGVYAQTISHMKKILDIHPVMAAHDLHPGYYSTVFAKQLGETGVPLVAVQHHHAHALSCMAENNLDGEVMAITLDGTGLGIDGHIWGGEILACSYKGFTRHARLSMLPMPGGDAAVLEPWRMAAALLYKTFGRAFLDLEIPYVRSMDRKKLQFLIQMMARGVNSPLTSSTGRLFDAVAALNGICYSISHDSQAAMTLEAIARRSGTGFDDGNVYDFEFRIDDHGCRVMDPAPLVHAMVKDIQNGIATRDISKKFHAGIVAAFTKNASQIRQETGLERVVLSGGVFNNDLIFTGMVDGLERIGFEVYTHSQVPCGDGGIALGQAMAAAARLAAPSGE